MAGRDPRADRRGKAGIFKRDVPAVSAPQADEAADVLHHHAREVGALALDFVTEPWKAGAVNLTGAHQRWNAAVAVRALALSGLRGPSRCRDERPARSAVARTLSALRRKAGPRRRAQSGRRLRLVETWREIFGAEKATLVLGVLADKDARAICAALLPLAARVIAVPVRSPRTAPPGQVCELFRELAPGIPCTPGETGVARSAKPRHSRKRRWSQARYSSWERSSWGSAEELEFTLRDSDPVVLAADLPRTRLAADALRQPSVAVLFSDVDGGNAHLDHASIADLDVRPIRDAVAAGRGRDYATAQPSPEDMAMLLYTSGSTGHPKGVVYRHISVGQALIHMMLAGFLPLEFSGPSNCAAAQPPRLGLVTVPLFTRDRTVQRLSYCPARWVKRWCCYANGTP